MTDMLTHDLDYARITLPSGTYLSDRYVAIRTDHAGTGDDLRAITIPESHHPTSAAPGETVQRIGPNTAALLWRNRGRGLTVHDDCERGGVQVFCRDGDMIGFTTAAKDDGPLIAELPALFAAVDALMDFATGHEWTIDALAAICVTRSIIADYQEARHPSPTCYEQAQSGGMA